MHIRFNSPGQISSLEPRHEERSKKSIHEVNDRINSIHPSCLCLCRFSMFFMPGHKRKKDRTNTDRSLNKDNQSINDKERQSHFWWHLDIFRSRRRQDPQTGKFAKARKHIQRLVCVDVVELVDQGVDLGLDFSAGRGVQIFDVRTTRRFRGLVKILNSIHPFIILLKQSRPLINIRERSALRLHSLTTNSDRVDILLRGLAETHLLKLLLLSPLATGLTASLGGFDARFLGGFFFLALLLFGGRFGLGGAVEDFLAFGRARLVWWDRAGWTGED